MRNGASGIRAFRQSVRCAGKLVPVLLLLAGGTWMASSLAMAGERAEVATPQLGLQPLAADGRLWVGRTGIMCYQAPCPWRGVIAADDGTLLWSGDELPALDATPADAERLNDSWAAFECLAVDGQFAAGRLAVETILGACSREDAEGL